SEDLDSVITRGAIPGHPQVMGCPGAIPKIRFRGRRIQALSLRLNVVISKALGKICFVELHPANDLDPSPGFRNRLVVKGIIIRSAVSGRGISALSEPGAFDNRPSLPIRWNVPKWNLVPVGRRDVKGSCDLLDDPPVMLW